MKAVKEYRFTSNGKNARIEYEYEKQIVDNINSLDGYRINMGKEILITSEARVYVEDKLVAKDFDVNVVTETNIKFQSNPNAKVGMLRIGKQYIASADIINAVKQMVAEAKEEGTDEETVKFEKIKAEEEKAKGIEEAMRTVKAAEKQPIIPTDAEYEKMKAWDESAFADFRYITKERYEAARAFLENNK